MTHSCLEGGLGEWGQRGKSPERGSVSEGLPERGSQEEQETEIHDGPVSLLSGALLKEGTVLSHVS